MSTIQFINRGSVPYGWTLANFLVFWKVRKALGLERCRFCLTAAAPIMKDTLDFFMSLNLPLMEIYGMSESSGQCFSLHLVLSSCVGVVCDYLFNWQFVLKPWFCDFNSSNESLSCHNYICLKGFLTSPGLQ